MAATQGSRRTISSDQTSRRPRVNFHRDEGSQASFHAGNNNSRGEKLLSTVFYNSDFSFHKTKPSGWC